MYLGGALADETKADSNISTTSGRPSDAHNAIGLLDAARPLCRLRATIMKVDFCVWSLAPVVSNDMAVLLELGLTLRRGLPIDAIGIMGDEDVFRLVSQGTPLLCMTSALRSICKLIA